MKGIKDLKNIICSAAAAAMLLFAPCTEAFAEDMPDFNVTVHTPPQIVFVGDSITSGYGLAGYSSDNKTLCDSFANMLSREFENELPAEADFRYYNEGLDGRTSGGMLELLRSGRLDEELKQADAVVVSVGGNDLLHTFLNIIRSERPREAIERALSLSDDLDRDLDGFAKNMPLIAEELSKRTDGRIILQTLYDPFNDSDISILRKMSEEKIGRLNSIIRENSDGGNRYVICDIAEGFSGRAKELTNIESHDIHPNAEGHKVLASLIGKTIREGSYTYYDYEAERVYLLAQENKRQQDLMLLKEQEENQRALKERSDTIAVSGAAAGSCAAVILAVLLIKHGRRHG